MQTTNASGAPEPGKFDGALFCRWPLVLDPRKQWEDPRGEASDCLEMPHSIVDRLYLRNRRLRA
eukprot:5647749-Pyramimonas_sp.AAC.1